MELMEALRARHSVRAYTDAPIEPEKQRLLAGKVAELNELGGLHLQLVLDEPQAFSGFLSHYSKFSGVRNYVAVVGQKAGDLLERCGYYGEQLVLFAQQLGLNSCWVGLTYSKVSSAFEVREGERLVLVIALGYGKTNGVQHKGKRAEQVSAADEAAAWFSAGVEAALLAPTAINQQKFKFVKKGNSVSASTVPGLFGSYAKIDLGIAKFHFEVGAGKENFEWA